MDIVAAGTTSLLEEGVLAEEGAVSVASVVAALAAAVQEGAGNMDRLETLLQYHGEDPDDSFIRFAVASEYRKRGDLQAALTWFEGLKMTARTLLTLDPPPSSPRSQPETELKLSSCGSLP